MFYKRINKLPSEEIGGELVLLDNEKDVFLSSNAVGAYVWRMLELPMSLDILCESVVEKFEGVEPLTVKKDLMEFLDILSEKGLVERVSQQSLD